MSEDNGSENGAPATGNTMDELMPLPKVRRRGPLGMVFVLGVLAVAGVVGFALFQGMRPTADELIAEGNVLVLQGEAEQAMVRFGRALELMPTSVDAHRGMANAYAAVDNGAKKVEWLDRALALDGLAAGHEAGLRDQLAKHYLREALRVGDVDPEAMEVSLVRAVGYNPRSTLAGKAADDMVGKGKAPSASGLLARHLLAKADRLEGEGKLQQAADALGRIAKLWVKPKLKEEALLEEVDLRLRLFRPKFAKELEDKHKAELLANGELDLRKDRFVAGTVVQTKREPGQSFRDHELDTHLKADGDARVALLELMARLAGKPRTNLDALPPSLTVWSLRAESNGWLDDNRRRYEMRISTPVDDGVRIIFLIRHRGDLIWEEP